MELVDTSQEAKTLYTGDDTIQISAGDYLSIRHGDIESPTIDLTEQVPAGKTWSVRLIVKIEET